MDSKNEELTKLSLSNGEMLAIARAVHKMDIKGGQWSIRHLEAMIALINWEIKRRYGLLD